ncbi:MAG TPA: hypothetical protein VGO90_16040 [Chthoniobacteraceae bacterium]|nr:hypothetical protein [Chthoniobacteraceae bacterium]
MNLAAIEGQVVLLALMALFGFISWISKKLTSGASPDESSSSDETPRPAQTRRPPAESEEERMRRFMEALGMPADQAPPPPVRRPVVPPRAAPPVPQAKPLVTPAPPSRPYVPPPIPTTARSLDPLPEVATPAGRMHVPELVSRSPAAYETVSSRVSAAGTQGVRPVTPLDPYRGRAGEQSVAGALRLALSSPQQMRYAFLMREIISPPLALR